MKMKMFTMDPVDRQGYSMNSFNEALAGAVHVETYTKDEGRFGGDRTIIVFAFYPDKDKDKSKCVPECADHVQELLEEKHLLQVELNMAKEMYPEEMRIVKYTLETVEELKS